MIRCPGLSWYGGCSPKRECDCMSAGFSSAWFAELKARRPDKWLSYL